MLKYSVNGQRCSVSRTQCYRMRWCSCWKAYTFLLVPLWRKAEWCCISYTLSWSFSTQLTLLKGQMHIYAYYFCWFFVLPSCGLFSFLFALSYTTKFILATCCIWGLKRQFYGKRLLNWAELIGFDFGSLLSVHSDFLEKTVKFLVQGNYLNTQFSSLFSNCISIKKIREVLYTSLDTMYH